MGLIYFSKSSKSKSNLATKVCLAIQIRSFPKIFENEFSPDERFLNGHNLIHTCTLYTTF